MRVGISVCLVGLFWTFSLSATPSYIVTALPLGPFSIPAIGEALSSNGMVAGQVNAQGFLWNGGAFSYVPTLGGSESPAFGVNSSGVVTGWSFTSSPTEDAYSYSGGTTTNLGPLIGGLDSQGSAINDSGVIVGGMFYAPNNAEAFELSGTTVTYLGFLPGGINSIANAISPSGLITGWADSSSGNDVFIYSTANGLVNIGNLGGPGSGTAINDAGQVAGYSYISGNAAQYAFLYSGGTMKDLGTLGGTNSAAWGINAAGWVVGAADTTTGTDAFIYINGVMYDLNSLLVNAPGIDLTSAVAINDNGQILANGPNGAYLLTETPEPASLWLAFAGLLPVLASARKRRRVKSGRV